MLRRTDPTDQPAPLVPILVLLGVASAVFGSQQESPAPTFPAKAELVVVDAVVLDAKGNPVEGLAAEDFQVEEDRRLQQIVSFEAVALPEAPAAPPPSRTRVSTNIEPLRPQQRRTFVIVFDNVHMAPDRIQTALRAVREFLRTSLGPTDVVTLIPTSGGAWWTAEMPEGSDDLAAALERLEGLRPRNTRIDRISDWEAMRLYLHRDLEVGAEVARRYYNHAIIPEPAYPIRERDELVDIGDTHPLIRAKAAEVYHSARTRAEAALKAVRRAAEALGATRGRKSLLLVSEGFIHDSSMGGFREVLDAARRTNVAVNFIDVRGLDTLPVHGEAEISEPIQEDELRWTLDEPLRESEGAVSVAADTGGAVVKNRNDLAQAMRQLAQETRAYYLIGYQPTNTKADGKFRKIEVKVARPGVTVRARKGYYAPDASGKRPKVDEDDLEPAVRKAIDSPFDGDAIPLRLTSFVLGPATDGRASVLLAAEADPAAFSFRREGKTGRFEAALETFMLVSARDSGENFHRERLVELSLPEEAKRRLEQSWLPILRDFQLAPGVYQARLMVRDRNRNRIGTVRHEFEVPVPEGLRTSTPILTDVVEPAPEGSQLPPRPVPTAHRTFAAGGRLFYVFEVFGAASDPGTGAPRVAVGYELRAADGTLLASQPPRLVASGPGGSVGQMIALSLGGALPGQHEIVLRVLDQVAGAGLEVRDPFEVAPRRGPRGPS